MAGAVVFIVVDRETDTVVSLLPSLGNIAFEPAVHGHNVLRYPHETIEAFRQNPNTVGIPLMGPWANRLDEQAFYANGQRGAKREPGQQLKPTEPLHCFEQSP